MATRSGPVVIINPISGAGGRSFLRVARDRAAAARDLLDRAGIAGEVRVTEGAGHAHQIATEAVAAGAGLVVAWGGDGTMNEVGAAIAGRGSILGIVPSGSGNGLARALGIPADPEAALRVALDGRVRDIDGGELAGRPFFNIAGLGFDAHVADLFNARAAGRRGLLPYVLLTLREVLRYEPASYRLHLPGEILERRALLVAFANGSQYGNGARIAPDALPDDGLLDVVVAGASSPVTTLWRARRLFNGTAAADPGVAFRRVAAVTVAVSGRAIAHVDGESFVPTTPVHVRVRPRVLRVRVP